MQIPPGRVMTYSDIGAMIMGKVIERASGMPLDRFARERIFLPGREPLVLDARDPVLHFLQRLRDEAHRFAIGTHRAKRSGRITHSTLDEIAGIGARRKKALLHHFGSLRAVAQAGRADLEAVEGISRSTANKIYEWFHPEH